MEMSSDVTIGIEPQTEQAQKTRWQRMMFASLTSGNPPSATFRAVGTASDGTVRHFSQAVRVTDDAVLLRLMRLPAGTEVRACVETDWNAPDLPVTLLDFCCVEDSDLTALPSLPAA